MRKSAKRLLAGLVLSLSMLSGQALAAVPASPAEVNEYTAECSNGRFIGAKEKETGVISFKGVPFAEQPTGRLRFRAPQPAKDSRAVFKAQEYGPIAVQLHNPAKGMIKEKMGEDCLNLNIWTSSLKKQKKPVMFWIHGGSYNVDDPSRAVYDGQFLAKEYKDIVVVTVSYRMNVLGFIDLSRLKGGENYPDSQYLGYLDVREALKWVRKNIASFGGDPDNVTVFGESAGSGMVTCLISDKSNEGLFRHAIAQSGAYNISHSQQNYDQNKYTALFMEAAGIKTLEELLNLPAEKITEVLTRNAQKFDGLNGFPLRGGRSPIPADIVKALKDGAAKDVDLIIGTDKDEMRYWIHEMGQDSDEKNLAAYNILADTFVRGYRRVMTPEENKRLDEYLKLPIFDEDKYSAQYPAVWRNTDAISAITFRLPALKMAEAHIMAGGRGRTYMYYFAKRTDYNDFLGAQHNSEIPYVFNNVKVAKHIGCADYGTIKPELAARLSAAWASFAKSGNPSAKGFVWKEYDLKDRETLVVGDDGTLTMVKDPAHEERGYLDFSYKYVR